MKTISKKSRFFFSYFIMLFLFVLQMKHSGAVYMMLSFSPKNSKKQMKYQELDELAVLYKGACYQVPISSKLGAQLIFKDTLLESKYYIMICESLHLKIDNKGRVKGYYLDEKEMNCAKLYAINMNILNNQKNEMTYNWNIEEIIINSHLIPENTIIIYGNPHNLSLKNFDTSFNKPYPGAHDNQSAMLIFPTLSFDAFYFQEDLIKNANASVETKSDHSLIKQNKKSI
jgi:hypothetical protein